MAPLLGGLALLLGIAPWINPWFWGPVPNVPRVGLAVLCGAALLHVLQWGRARGLAPSALLAWLAWGWLGAALLSAVIGLFQYFGAATPIGVFPDPQGLGEAYGNLHQRNLFATHLNIGLAALFWLAGRAPLPRRGMVLASAAALLLAAANAASSSRVGFVNLLLLLVLSHIWPTPMARRLAWTALLGYGLALLTLPMLIGLAPGATGLLARLQAEPPACTSRVTLWGNVLHLIAMKPWTGWGWGELSYAHFITLYPGARFCDILDNAHNLPLHLAVELGLPAALAACGLALWCVLRMRPWAEVASQRQLAWSVLGVLGAHSMLEYPLWYGPFMLAALLAAVLLLPRMPALSLQAGAAALAVVAALSGYTLWDYWRVGQLYMPEGQRASIYQADGILAVQGSRLFARQVQFADLNVTPLAAYNAELQYATAQAMLHVSPEPWVIERVLASARLLGRTEDEAFYAARYEAAFPQPYARWRAEQP